jgi:hypothetical protein
MATKAKKQELVVKSNYTVNDVPQMLETLKGQLEELRSKNKDTVSLNITYNERKIEKLESLQELLEISASVHAREKAYNEEVQRYKLEGEVVPFSTSGKNVKEWEEIIEKAIFELKNRKKINDLEEAISELSKYVSEEEKFRNSINAIVQKVTKPIS